MAQGQQALPRIGLVSSETPGPLTERLIAFRQGLGQGGYEEGRNVVVEYRWAEGKNDRLPSLAADLVGRKVSVIVALGSVAAALATKSTTATIPIVFQIGSNPVDVGLVSSLNRPGGNVTGITSLNSEVGPKRLELLRELLPNASTTALLVNPLNPSAGALSTAMQAAARSLGFQNNILRASSENELDNAFATLVQTQTKGLVIGTDAFFTGQSQKIAAMALKHSIAAIYQFRLFAQAGGLVSYGGSFSEVSRLAGAYVARILKGEKPADLPVVQSTKVEMIVNLKTAKALGITVPLSLLGRADEVIE